MSDIPEELKKSINEAEDALATSKDGVLFLPARRRISVSLGSGERGHGRRSHLALSCAERVIPIWNEAFADINDPESIIKSTRDYMNGNLDELSLRQEISDLWTKLDDLMYEGDNLEQINAGYAAASAASVAISDELLDIDDSFFQISDEDLDPYDWDAGFYASLAVAGGAPGEGASDPIKRHEFWLWYLSDAVPQAWSAV